MMRIFGRTVAGARGFANKRRSAGSQVDRRGRKLGSLFVAAFAGLSAATATPAAAGCQTTTTSVTASPATLNTGSAAQTLSLSATVLTLNQKLTTTNQSTCSRGAGIAVTTGQLVFTLKNSSATTIGSPVTVSASSAVNGVFSASYSVPANQPQGAYSLVAAYTGIGFDTGQNENGDSSTTNFSALAIKAPQTISFTQPANQTFVLNATVPLTVSASSGLSVTLTSSNASICTISGSNAVMKGTGTCSITASQTGSAIFHAADSVTRSFTIKANQTIAAAATPNPIKFNQTSTVSASGGAGTGTFSYAKTSGPCTLVGTTVTPTGVGACVITATKATDANYNSATADVTITIDKADQTIAFTSTAPVSPVFGGAYTATTTGGASGNAVTFSTESTACTVSSTGAVAFVSPGSCVIKANQAGNTNYNAANEATQSLTVGKAPATLVITPVPAQVLGSGAVMLTSTSPSTGAVTYTVGPNAVCTNVGPAVTLVGVGECSVNATQVAGTNHLAATAATVKFNVTDTTNPVIASCPANITEEATSPSGGTASWTAPTASDNSGSVTLTTTHNPGATFRMGPATQSLTQRPIQAAIRRRAVSRSRCRIRLRL